MARFAELAKLVDPDNEPKTDKLSILAVAIRFVQQTQLENSQLRQLNKFLEVSVYVPWREGGSKQASRHVSKQPVSQQCC